MDSKTRARFNAELPKAYSRVLAEALLLVRRTRWRHGTDKTIQERAEDLVGEAVFRTLDGRRTWDPERVPDLHFFLKEAMRSIVSSEAASPRSRTTSLDSVKDGFDWTATTALRTGERVRTPEEEVAVQQEVQQQLDHVLNAADKDPVLTRIVDAFMSGCEKAAEIAEESGLEVEQVYEGMRKLRRRLGAAGKKAQP